MSVEAKLKTLAKRVPGHRTGTASAAPAVRRESKKQPDILMDRLQDPRIEDFKIIESITEQRHADCCTRPAMVRVAVHIPSQKYVILKSIMKDKCNPRDQRLFFQERQLLRDIDSPFGPKFLGSFQSTRQVYIAMEYIPGEELFLYNSYRVLNEPLVKFYAAQVVLFLEDLQRVGAVYRDIKPENVIISSRDGCVRVVDYGYAAYLDPVTKTLHEECGTRNYLCPQKIWRVPYGMESDMWSLGIFLYELLKGEPPFPDGSNLDLCHRFFEPKFLWEGVDFRGMSEVAQDLIQHLCVTDAKQRFTLAQVKSHQWFQNFDWSGIYNKTVPAPPLTQLNKRLAKKQRQEEGENQPHQRRARRH